MECQEAYQQLVSHLEKLPTLTHPYVGETLFLYLAISTHSLSGVLIAQRTNEQMPIYYVSKTLLDAETRYLPLEKLLWALVTVSRKLPHYFQSHPITVLTNFPLKDVLRRADLSERVSKWGVELNAYYISFHPRTAFIGQVLADFITKFADPSSSSNDAAVQASLFELGGQ